MYYVYMIVTALPPHQNHNLFGLSALHIGLVSPSASHDGFEETLLDQYPIAKAYSDPGVMRCHSYSVRGQEDERRGCEWLHPAAFQRLGAMADSPPRRRDAPRLRVLQFLHRDRRLSGASRGQRAPEGRSRGSPRDQG